MTSLTGVREHSVLQRLRVLAYRCGSWWLREFLSLFPVRTSDWLMGRNERRLLLTQANGVAELSLFRGQKRLQSLEVQHSDDLDHVIARLRALSGTQRTNLQLELELPRSACFFRHFDMPSVARDALPKLLIQEIEHKTPFKIADIHHGHRVELLPDNAKLRVQQVIVRRDLVELEMAKFELLPERVAGLAIAGDRMTLPLRGETPVPRGQLRTPVLLIVTAALIGFGGMFYIYRGQEKVLAALEQQISEVKPLALTVRAQADKITQEQLILSQIRAQKLNAATLAEVLDEITRILPNDVWLSEFKLVEGKANERDINIAGLATGAAGLVGRINASAMFFDASLTAAIVPDPVEKRERFSLQARIKNGQVKGIEGLLAESPGSNPVDTPPQSGASDP